MTESTVDRVIIRGDELVKVVRHRVEIAGNKYAARFGRDSEDLRIGTAFRYDSCGRLKINCRFSSPEPTLESKSASA